MTIKEVLYQSLALQLVLVAGAAAFIGWQGFGAVLANAAV